MSSKKTEFKMLNAFHGDSILIKTFDKDYNEFVILIDGGTAQTFKYSLKTELESLSRINLIILSHVDSDHIGGLINFFNSSLANRITIDEIWMNHPELIEVNTGNLISTAQGDNLRVLISEKLPKVKLREISTDSHDTCKNGIEFVILSPTQEIVNTLYKRWESTRLKPEEEKSVNISYSKDIYTKSLAELNDASFNPDQSLYQDIYNASSISFLLKCPDVSILLLADSRPEIITQRLRDIGYDETYPLVVDYVKISHHGSLNNTSQELLSLIKTNNFIISTNGGFANHKHPSRETIARIAYNSNRTDERINIFFNYKIEELKNKIGDFINDKDLEVGNFNAEHKNNFTKNE